MAGRRLVTLGYILVFWGGLPGILAALAAWGEHAFGPKLRLPDLLPAALLIAGVSGSLLALSIIQYTREAGSLPVSAFPPRRLIRSGFFGIWRHPIYLFSVFCFSGLAMVFWPAGSLLVAFPALAIGALVYAKIEEGGLAKRFGSIYAGHRRQTSILIPRLPHLVRPPLRALSRWYFRFEVSGRENGALAPPFIVLSAHRNYLDSVFISLALDVPIHFVTTFEMFRNFGSRLIFSKLLSLPKKRYKPDVRNALDIRRRLVEGCAVGIFPEAERSWTGAMIRFKPEVLKLLRLHPEIPILPVRLEGTYAAWPRWARLPRRSKVSVVVERPVFASREETPAELEARLCRLVQPHESPDSRRRTIAAKGIESLLYRCPECLSFDTIQSGLGPGFRCSSCRTDFRLFSDLSIEIADGGGRLPLAEAGRRARVISEGSPPVQDSGIGWARAKLSVEKAGRLEVAGEGRLGLSASRLSFETVGPPVHIDLDDIRSVVIEGGRKLQVYGGRPACLFQFRLLGQSPLKWQDLIVVRARNRRGLSPSTA